MLDTAPSPRLASSPGFDEVPLALLEGEVSRIVRSRPFRQSARHRRFLRHLVKQAAAGDAAALKESVLACEVFERALGGFDPAQDTILHGEALRQRLDRYYRSEGRDARLEIHLPVGSYVPLLRGRLDAEGRHAGARRTRDLVERGEHFLRQPLSRQTLLIPSDPSFTSLHRHPHWPRVVRRLKPARALQPA